MQRMRDLGEGDSAAQDAGRWGILHWPRRVRGQHWGAHGRSRSRLRQMRSAQHSRWGPQWNAGLPTNTGAGLRNEGAILRGEPLGLCRDLVAGAAGTLGS